MSRLKIIDIFSQQKTQEDHSEVERFLKAVFGTEQFIPQRDQLGFVLADGDGKLSDEDMEWISAAGYGERRNNIKTKNKDHYFDI